MLARPQGASLGQVNRQFIQYEDLVKDGDQKNRSGKYWISQENGDILMQLTALLVQGLFTIQGALYTISALGIVLLS